MIPQSTIHDAVQDAVAGGQFLAVRLEKENPEALFAVGFAAFMSTIVSQVGDVRLSDVSDALIIYARSRARSS